MAPRTFTLNFMGDTMLGRLIDQMCPNHVEEPEEARIVRLLQNSGRAPSTYNPNSPWGNTLPLLHSADVNILNLETSATTHATKWPNKVFNYRMHPANIAALQSAKINYAGLANNHTLDFCEAGLLETVQTVRQAGISFAGAGESEDEARRPAVLRLPDDGAEHEVRIWAAANHPGDWARVSTFHFIDYTAQTRSRLKELLTKSSRAGKQAALKIFSVHWGPNYSWHPAAEIRDLAHFLVDECDVDIVHGHSSHHVQGVERYEGKLIIYGCGDFVDDYAVTPGFRNDLSGIWRVVLEETYSGDEPREPADLRVKRLEVYPTKIDRFRARRLEASESDAHWVCEKIRELSRALDTDVHIDEKQPIVTLDFE